MSSIMGEITLALIGGERIQGYMPITTLTLEGILVQLAPPAKESVKLMREIIRRLTFYPNEYGTPQAATPRY